jgi:hypothetical protein
MITVGQSEEIHISTLEVDRRQYNVTVAVANDGIEHVGHLWFTDEEWEDEGVRDHGALPGRSTADVLEHARALSTSDLTLRFRRAQAERRRFVGLRKVTEQVLEHIRHLNKVATLMRAGMLEVDDAASEIDQTERKLHGMIDQLRDYAGVTA